MPCRGELHSPYHNIDVFPYLRNNGTLPSSYPSTLGFHVNLPCNNREETIRC